MDAFKPFLGIGLKNYAEYQVGQTRSLCACNLYISHLLSGAEFSTCVSVKHHSFW